MHPSSRIALFWYTFLLLCMFTAACVFAAPVFLIIDDMPRLLGACLGAFCGACSSLLAYWVWEDAQRDWLLALCAPCGPRHRHKR